jgi:Glycosyl transferases group 1
VVYEQGGTARIRSMKSALSQYLCSPGLPLHRPADTEEYKSRSFIKLGLIYDSSDCHITVQALRDALPETRGIHFDLSVLKPNADIRELLRKTMEPPGAIWHEVGARGLPRGLEAVPIPTVGLDVDTFGWTDFRLHWAMLFDYVFTWHPSYVRLFLEAGHPRVFALPHAVDVRFYNGSDLDSERIYDLGFVGNFGLPHYARRDKVNSGLARRFRTNTFYRKYTREETVDIYRRSKIVVNVSRSEFPQEANMRCYEAMAGGALLMTEIPTELTEWGFRESEHFIGWRSEQEIPDLVDRFLRQEEQRFAIARAARERTLKDFTFQRCIETIVSAVEKDGGQLFAPARHWRAEKVHLLYLSYYHRLQLTCAALGEFRHLRRVNPKAYWKGLPTVLKTLRRALKSTLL